MTRARRLLMVAFVATALSADRLASAAPDIRPPVVDAARQLAGKLVVGLRRSVPAARLLAVRREGRAQPVVRIAPSAGTPTVHRHDLSPFQFRLPPPIA